MKDINFLRERRRNLSKTQKQDQQWFKWSGYGLGGVVLVLIVIFVTHLFFTNRIKAIQQDQKNTTQSIIDNEATEKTFLLTLQKLTVLNELYTQRRSKQAAIDDFTSIFPDTVEVKGIEYSDNDRLLSFQLSSQDVFVLENVFATLTGSELKARYEKVTPSNLRRTDSGRYEMNVAVVLKQP